MILIFNNISTCLKHTDLILGLLGPSSGRRQDVIRFNDSGLLTSANQLPDERLFTQVAEIHTFMTWIHRFAHSLCEYEQEYAHFSISEGFFVFLFTKACCSVWIRTSDFPSGVLLDTANVSPYSQDTWSGVQNQFIQNKKKNIGKHHAPVVCSRVTWMWAQGNNFKGTF